MNTNATDTHTTTFKDLGLGASLLAAISDAGYSEPTAIQAGAIPLLLAGRDIIGQARTGTGKTAAFALPMLEEIEVKNRVVQGLILTPTRELAIQIAEAMEGYASHSPGLEVLPIYGGQAISVQLRQLHRGVHVVVGTPGRILDHLRRKSLSFEHVQAVVLDEADEMLRMGFIDDVEAILKETPRDRHTALFSATMPRAIDAVARKHLDTPERITIKSQSEATIEQRFIRVRKNEKFMALDRLLRTSDHQGVLVFAQRRADTEAIAAQLNRFGHRAEALNGDLSQQQREKVVQRLRDGAVNIVVGTDVAARGLDVDHLSLVINFDIPQDLNTYTHRVGRTGRAGREGMAISLVSKRQIGYLRKVEKQTKQPITTMAMPTEEKVASYALSSHKARIREMLADPQDLPNEQYELVKSLVAEGYHMTQVAAAASALAGGTTESLPTTAQLKNFRLSSSRSSGSSRSSRSSRSSKRKGRKSRGRGRSSRRNSGRKKSRH